MTEKLGTRWFICALVFGLATWATVTNFPLNLGIDLSGGVTIAYSVDPNEVTKQSGAGPGSADPLADTIRVISTRLDTLGVKDLSVRREGANRIVIQAPRLSEAELAETKRRMVQLGELEFLIGLGKLDYKDPKRQVDSPGSSPGVFEKYTFDQDVAEKQRKDAIEAGTKLIAEAKAAGKPGLPADAYRDGMTYELKSPEGRPLGIFWKPWAPHLTAKEKHIKETEARQALERAEKAESYNADHITGGWLYADPQWYGAGIGFTGHDIENPRGSSDELGRRTVVYDVVPHRRSDFERYTNKYVNWPMCLVLNDEIWSAPTIEEALSDHVQIKGGGTGGFEKEQQDWLVNCLQSGSLKLRPRLESEDKVGPLLGEQAVQRGELSIIVAAALIFGFVLVYYRFNGAVAAISLLLNLFLTIAVMALFRATLTLPGIAGLVLSLGMSIDANILISERIREELDKGKALLPAVQAGFDRAFSAILDGNLTTIITSILLYKYGVGPIKGFAVTLAAGLICSQFTAVFFAKTLFATALKAGMVKKVRMLRMLPQHLHIRFLDKSRFWVTVSIIAVVASIGIFFATGTKKYGLDFTGGYSVRLGFTSPTNVREVEEAVIGIRSSDGSQPYTQVQAVPLSDSAEAGGYKAFDVKVQSLQRPSAEKFRDKIQTDLSTVFGTELKDVRNALPEADTGDWTVEFGLNSELNRNQVLERLATIKDVRGGEPYQGAGLDHVTLTSEDPLTGERLATEWRLEINEKNLLGDELLNSLLTQFRDRMPRDAEGATDIARAVPKLTYLGPNVVADLKEKAIIAIVLGMIANIIYIWFRFKELKYGVAAVVAVFHDCIVAGGIALLCHRLGIVDAPVDLSMIAALLTVLGSSLNDTIVIFDRMRENLGNVKGSFREVLNLSINQTLDRTILTALLVFFTVVSLFAFNYGQQSGIEGMAFIIMVGVIVGAYSTVFIATPIVVWLHDREERKKGIKPPTGTAPVVAVNPKVASN